MRQTRETFGNQPEPDACVLDGRQKSGVRGAHASAQVCWRSESVLLRFSGEAPWLAPRSIYRVAHRSRQGKA